jgi:hypothetical protein
MKHTLRFAIWRHPYICRTGHNRYKRDLHSPAVVLPTHWDNFLLPYEASQQPALDVLQSFLHEIAVVSPKTKVIVPKYFQPIPLAK